MNKLYQIKLELINKIKFKLINEINEFEFDFLKTVWIFSLDCPVSSKSAFQCGRLHLDYRHEIFIPMFTYIYRFLSLFLSSETIWLTHFTSISIQLISININ